VFFSTPAAGVLEQVQLCHLPSVCYTLAASAACAPLHPELQRGPLPGEVMAQLVPALRIDVCGLRDKGGKPTAWRVLRGLDVLKRHDVEWNVLTTIHAVNGDHGGAVYRYLRDELGPAFTQFIPVIRWATRGWLPVPDPGWGAGVWLGGDARPVAGEKGGSSRSGSGGSRAGVAPATLGVVMF